ncbi:MAG: hypothetical protein M1814_004945 [Vezdaea aestivalis]|nr:MAG: hypothetical protein M1814_004945 [Vezdaea aestivalis]
MASNKDSALYGTKQHRLRGKELSSSTPLSFKSQLSSLVSTSRSSNPQKVALPSCSNHKDDIFTAHRQTSKKRKAHALNDEDGKVAEQQHKADIGGIDSADLARSKRKMEEKARLYAAMKRGDYIGKHKSEDKQALVDFDRKWAEAEEAGRAEDEDDDESSDDGVELIEYTDEFGRSRFGSRAEIAREQRRRRLLSGMGAEDEEFSARPNAPSNLIYGATVQADAFNPDEPVAAQMANLAAKRDRSLTPPPEEHYDATKEVRTKGVGFYQFSKGEDDRRREMGQLERERVETERERGEREAKKVKRKEEKEERKRKIAEMKAGREADAFLEGLRGGLQTTRNEGKERKGPLGQNALIP